MLLIREGAVPRGATAVSIRVPKPQKIKVRLRNVVGLLPGASNRDEHVVVSAHYDHVGVGLPKNGDPIYNGADDDATGTTAVVLLAEALAKREKKLPRTLAFVGFSAEEKGLRGSREFVKTCPWPLEKTASNLNIEMIGRPQRGRRNAAWMTGADLSDFRDVVTPALKRAGLEVVPFAMADRLFAASDNASFARKGIVAHSISAGSLHNDYHQPSDEVKRLDLEHMANVIRGLYEAAVALASTETKLTYNEKGRRRLRLD